MSSLDILIFIAYGLVILLVGNFLHRSKEKENSSSNYFFASNSLPWYLIGTSIIAANISAEQFIGMSGSGYAIGLGIATYEWIAALILIVVAKYFLPILIKNEIYTMPQFMAYRYDNRIKTILAVFWIALFVLVNITSILYLGALTIKILLDIPLIWAIVGLAVFTLLYSVFNGLKAIASTDIIQVFFLVSGGLMTTYLALNATSDGNGIIEGFKIIANEAPEKLHMIIKSSDPNFTYLPGWRAIFGGIWIAGIYYFGANQYIIQKALGAKNLREAQRGMAFAGFLKVLIPLIVVVPGIAAFVLDAKIDTPDGAYPWLLNTFIPSGFKGFIFAALIAAIVSSLSAIINSTSTIFTMDIYKNFFHKTASEKQLVKTGRLSGVLAMIIAASVAPLLGRVEQAFQFIQEFTGMLSPGITAIFILGLFWKKTTSNAAFFGIIISLPASIFLKFVFPAMPFLDKMLCAFLFTSFFMVVWSLLEGRMKTYPKAINVDKRMFKTDRVFNMVSIGIFIMLLALYIVFW
ncbi:sodium/solute symporter [Antarcticibacterium sp. 1MA-6-2]|uniref:sodium:solute symporter family transporter n=1 Tax=Antarcticibacterium sp. 1MA-6-2 TaxID=2908210 RepID=UPI001EEABA43|nr:sodium/solute symporter [Antarcticibacterium sp. 1MA-6-2]UJH92666.1 sodium/solute symporter [Antarcticibacterium sp. 1MA-6-2]